MSLRVLGKDWCGIKDGGSHEIKSSGKFKSLIYVLLLIRNFQKNMKFKNKYRQTITEAFIFQEKAVFLI